MPQPRPDRFRRDPEAMKEKKAENRDIGQARDQWNRGSPRGERSRQPNNHEQQDKEPVRKKAVKHLLSLA